MKAKLSRKIFTLVLLCVALVGLPSTINAQATGIEVGFEDIELGLGRGEQAEVRIVITGAAGENGVSLEVRATGGIEIVDLSTQQLENASDFLEVNPNITGSVASLDIAKTSEFTDEEELAVVTIAMTSDEDGSIVISEATRVGDTEPTSLGNIDAIYTGEDFNQEEETASDSTQPDLLQQIQDLIQDQPLIIVAAIAVIIVVIIVLILMGKPRKKKEEKDTRPPIGALNNGLPSPAAQTNSSTQAVPSQPPAQAVPPAAVQPVQTAVTPTNAGATPVAPASAAITQPQTITPVQAIQPETPQPAPVQVAPQPQPKIEAIAPVQPQPSTPAAPVVTPVPAATTQPTPQPAPTATQQIEATVPVQPVSPQPTAAPQQAQQTGQQPVAPAQPPQPTA